MKLKRLGTIVGLGVFLIIVGLIVAVTPVEVPCGICDGSGKTDCVFCTDGSQSCIWCDGTGWKDCIFCEDGKVDCIYCTDGCEYCDYKGWNTCTYCNGEGGETCGECGGDGLVNCTFCDGRGWNTCTFCDGTGKVMSHLALLIPGGIIVIVGITLVPTAFIVSKD